MKTLTNKLTVLTLFACLLGAGAAFAQADMSRYVAIGDSLGAGFLSGGLYGEAQRYSYPALIYRAANGTDDGFALPTVTAPGIPPLLQLQGLSPVILTPAAGFGFPDNTTFPGLYGNLSVPGADINDILNTRQGGLNDIVLRGLGTQLELALAQQPTMVSLWVNNDILGAAISGVVIDGVTMTTLADFEARFRAVTGAIKATGAGLVLATIVDPVTIPFVTTIPPIVVDANNNPVIIGGSTVPLIGPEGPLTLGQDFVLLSAGAELAAGFGIPVELGGNGQPLSTFSVLSAGEAAAIATRVDEFNAVIQSVVDTNGGVAIFDATARLRAIARNGVTIGGLELSTDFLTGGLFSYDAVHPGPLAYAITANGFIDAINETFGNNIPRVGYVDYIFGGRNGIGTGLPVGGGATQAVMTPKAVAHLMEALDVPSKKQLRRILRRQAQRQGQN